MTLKSSFVIFEPLETSAASLTSAASATLLASTASKAQFPQKGTSNGHFGARDDPTITISNVFDEMRL